MNYIRTHQQLMEDCAPLGCGLCGPENARQEAIVTVLCSLPEDVYQTVLDRMDDFDWFIPHQDVYGMVMPFFITSEPTDDENVAAYARVAYLAPKLEEVDEAVRIAVVAHELAHVVLDHSVMPRDEEEYTKQESEIDKKLCEWGFEAEVKAHRESIRKRTME